jgi:colicin import membrane protein
MLSNEWKLPLNMAIGVHVLVLLGALYLPGIFKAKPKFADIYTVSIINIAEPVTTPPPEVKPQQESPPPVITKPPKTKKMVSITETESSPEPAPVKAVSLKPLKKKKIKKVKKVETNTRQKDLERKKRQRLAKAIREEELLTEKARLAQEALEAERRLLQPQKTVSSRPAAAQAGVKKSTGASSAAGGSSTLIESQYYASIFNKLLQYWALPEYLQNDSSLLAVVVITISKDGTIVNMFFENRADNRVFNQFVTKTIEAAAPLPPIPPALKKQRIELGLRFRPGSIQ